MSPARDSHQVLREDLEVLEVRITRLKSISETLSPLNIRAVPLASRDAYATRLWLLLLRVRESTARTSSLTGPVRVC